MAKGLKCPLEDSGASCVGSRCLSVLRKIIGDVRTYKHVLE